VRGEELNETEITRLLSLAVRGGHERVPNREDLLAALVDDFERRSGRADAAHHGELVVVIDDELDRERPRRYQLGSLAAALLLVVGALVFFTFDRNEPETVEVATEGERRLVTATEFPAPIAAGVHRSDLIGSGVTLTLPSGFEVIEEIDGRLVLGRVGDPSTPRARIMLIEVDEELEAAVAALVESGSIEAITTVDVVSGELVRTWELRLTNEGARAAGCHEVGPCVSLGDLSLWSNAVNYVTEIVTSDDERVWWVEQSAIHLDPFLEEGAGVLGTLEFG